MNLLRRVSPNRSLVLLSATLLLGCGGEGSGPVTASSMTSPGGTSLSGTVGQAILVEVMVTGSNGKAFAGGVVSFSVTSGGGSVSPGQANTDQTGRASATWTLGTTAGNQSLSASSGAASLQFTATAQAGQPTSIESLTSFPGQFSPGEPLAQAATFVVRDQFNNGVVGATVAFQASDGGSASPAQGTTGSDGRVSTTWTLGPLNGVQTLSATVTGISAATVTAEAYDPCLDVKAYAIGQTATGTITSASCEIEFDNEVRFADLYHFSITNSGAYRFTVTSSFQNPFFLLFDPGVVAGVTAGFGTDLTIRVFLDDGGSTKTYFPWIASDAGGVGSYTLSSGTTPATMQNCESWASTKTLSTSQGLSPTDCAWSYNGETHFSDLLTVWIDAGETLVMTESSTFFDTWLWLLQEDAGGSYTIIAANDDFGGTLNSRLEFTATESGFYHIAPTSVVPLGTGGYTLTISSTGGSSAAGRPAPATALPGALLPSPAPELSDTRVVRAASGVEGVRKR
jgi:hypothetical protein